MTMGYISFFQIWIYFSVLPPSPLRVGTVFMRQNLSSVDARFWRIKTIPYSQNTIFYIELNEPERAN